MANNATSLAQQSNSGERAQPAAAGDQKASQQTSPVAPPVEKPGPQLEATVANQQAQTEQPDPYNLRDLIAQEDMAEAAFLMVVAAFMTFFITTVGTIFLALQVRLTRQAVEETGEATEAMREANVIAKETAQGQLRAYVFFRKIRIENLAPNAIPLVHYEIWNVGQTPAFGLSQIVKAFGGTSEATMSAEKVHFHTKPEIISRANIGGGSHSEATIRYTDEPITQQAYDLIMEGKLILGLFGVAWYRDIYKRRHITTFKVMLPTEQIKDGKGVFYACDKSNRAN